MLRTAPGKAPGRKAYFVRHIGCALLPPTPAEDEPHTILSPGYEKRSSSHAIEGQ